MNIGLNAIYFWGSEIAVWMFVYVNTRRRMQLSILEYAEKELQVELSCLQKNLLEILQNDSDYVQYVEKRSHAMVAVLDIYNKWKESRLLAM
jgi:hypothetical protein